MTMAAKLKAARIGDTLHVFDETTEAAVKSANIVPDGHAANYPDGSSEWIIDEPVVDLAKTGDADKKLLVCEYGLMSNQEAASGAVRDLT